MVPVTERPSLVRASPVVVPIIPVGDAVAVAGPAAGMVGPLLAAADMHAVPPVRHVAVALPGSLPLARVPHILIADQTIVARRPDVAGTRHRHDLVARRRWRRAEGNAHLRGRWRKRGSRQGRRRKEGDGG